ncbi:patatin-like phospholipase family protein [Thioalkalivibrio sulfidiphilus]|uniref:patatin-like phospholipase family protein n=1 Tax=Thioalkalivibrio sulfidiphilus TaxID=1033854 RepID=UPI003BB15963
MGKRLISVCLLLLVVSLSGCVTPRQVDQPTCSSFEPRLVGPSPVAAREEINVLALSAGGPWGAYGIGFLNGWSEAQEPPERRRPQFDIAVGVSTGAMFVTHAFLGPEYDDLIREQIKSMTTRDVFHRRSLPAILLGDSLADTRPLRGMLEAVITRELLDQVAEVWEREGRRVAVIAVDMDCGNPELLDLTAVALERDRPDRISRYIDYLMASSASPVAFPPVFLEGRMLVDGALRQHIPSPGQIEELMSVYSEAPQQVNLYLIVNSPLMTIPECIRDHVLLIALRTGDVWTGERSVDSVALTIVQAERRGWRTRYVVASGTPCQPNPPPDDYFNPAFMQCQYEYGYRTAVAVESPWLEGLDALPSPGETDADFPHPCVRR